MLIRTAVTLAGLMMFVLAVLCLAAPNVASATGSACIARTMMFNPCATLDTSNIDDYRAVADDADI